MISCPHCNADVPGGEATTVCPSCRELLCRRGDTHVMPVDAVSPWQRLAISQSAAEPGDGDRLSSALEQRLVVKQRNLHRSETPAAEAMDYELLEKIGEGGMGVVYEARQTCVDRTIALKMIRPDRAAKPDLRAKFLGEAAVTGDLDHPNIVPIYELGATADGGLFYAMKQIKGVPWQAVLPGKSEAENLDILMRVADAVAFAHSRGVIHRDLKPENVMLGDYGEVLVMDWGMALAIEPTGKAPPLSPSSSIGGTPAYMAPEMAMAAVDRIGYHTDVYLLGAILYEIISGHPPHRGVSLESLMQAAAHNDIPPLVPLTELGEIALRAMRSDPADRYADVKVMQTAIQDYRSHRESVVLASRADQDLATARQRRSYEDFAQALFGYCEALSLWSGNSAARTGELVTRHDYAYLAHSKGDLDLAESLLRADTPSHAALARTVADSRRARAAQRRRQAVVINISRTLVAAILLTLTIAFFWIRAEKTRAELARRSAESAQASERQLRQLAEGEKARALTAEVRARSEAERAEAARRAEAEQRLRAEAAKAAAEDAKRTETELRRQSEVAEQNAVREKVRAEQAEQNALAAKARAEAAEKQAREEKEKAIQAHRQADEQRVFAELQRQSAVIERLRAEDEKEKAITMQLAAEEARQQTQSAEEEVRKVRQDLEAQQSKAAIAESKAQDAVRHKERLNYVARILQVHNKLAEGDRQLAIELLKACPAGLRGWEWGRLLHLCSATSSHLSHRSGITALALDSEARWLATAAGTEVAVWDLPASKRQSVLPGDFAPVQQLAFAAAGPRLLAVHDDGRISTWHRLTGEWLQTIGDTRDRPVCVALAADGQTGISGYADGSARLWDVASGKSVARLTGHTGAVRAVALSPDGRLAVTGSDDTMVGVWRLQEHDGELVVGSHTFSSNDPPQDDVWPDAVHIKIAAPAEIARVADRLGPKLLRSDHRHSAPVTVVGVCGGRVLSADATGQITVWDAESGRDRFKMHLASVSSGQLSADGKTVCAASDDGSVRIWDCDRGLLTAALFGHHQLVTTLQLTSTGGGLVSGDRNGKVNIWDVAASRALWVLSGVDAGVTSLAAANGTLASGHADGRARLWRLASGELTATIWDGGSSVEILSFANDGALLAGVREGGESLLWDLAAGAAGRARVEVARDPAAPLPSPDGKWVLQREGNLATLLYRQSGKPVVVFRGHTDEITCAAFAPDSDRVVTGSRDATVKVWDIHTGVELLTLEEPVSAVDQVLLDGATRSLVAGLADGTIMVWPAAAWN